MKLLHFEKTAMVVSGNDLKIVHNRIDFSTQYCQQKGWDVEKLDLDQIMEIRAQPGWKEASR